VQIFHYVPLDVPLEGHKEVYKTLLMGMKDFRLFVFLIKIHLKRPR
jgi:hypothetical protein